MKDSWHIFKDFKRLSAVNWIEELSPDYGATSFAASAPSFAASAPSFAASAPSFAASAPSFAASAPSFAASCPAAAASDALCIIAPGSGVGVLTGGASSPQPIWMTRRPLNIIPIENFFIRCLQQVCGLKNPYLIRCQTSNSSWTAIYQDVTEKHARAAVPCNFLPDGRMRRSNCNQNIGNFGILSIIGSSDARFSSEANGLQGQLRPSPHPWAQNAATGRGRDALSSGLSSADHRE